MFEEIDQAGGTGRWRWRCARWRWHRPRRPRTSSPRCSAVRRRPPRGPDRVPFANEAIRRARSLQGDAPRAAGLTYGGGQAYCVRTCDGRYFPAAGPDRESRAASCNSFCPASKTELVYGSNIDSAATAKRQALFRTAQRVPLSQRDRCGLHLQRQGSSSAWRQSRSRTTRPCARATSSPARMACMVATAAPTGAAPAEFHPGCRNRSRRAIATCRWWRGKVRLLRVRR